MAHNDNVDIKENDLLKLDAGLLEILLKDMTTDKNIIWATDNYSKYGSEYSSEKEIKIELITSNNGEIIKPRVEKSKEEQQLRVRQKAEV
ncbi:MAG: restriction endonuclease subunit M, partial [Treponema sp.]|nr:restriction endonuclease subunit M [Treponema sp.]